MTESTGAPGREASGESASSKPESGSSPKPAKKPAAPARDLPSQADIAAWIQGSDCPSIAALLEGLVVMKFDALVMQIRKAEILPQHWQVISQIGVADESEFERLPEVARLRRSYGDSELADRRLRALRTAWIELRGKKPTLWSVPDLFAALRRIIEKKIAVDFHDLLSAVRDIWRGMTLPQAEEQLEILWSCLSFIRDKTKK